MSGLSALCLLSLAVVCPATGNCQWLSSGVVLQITLISLKRVLHRIAGLDDIARFH